MKSHEAESSEKRNEGSSEPVATENKKGEAKKDAEARGVEDEQGRNKATGKMPVPEPVAAPKPKGRSAA